MPKKYTSVYSWNVNGIRSVSKKGFLDWLEKTKPDILCLQETKAQVDQLSDELLHPNGYMGIWNSPTRKGYSGVATFVRGRPLLEVSSFSNEVIHSEGRLIITEHTNFFVFNVYIPNGKRDNGRLDFKLAFQDQLLVLMKRYNQKKPVVLCGDLNTAHKEIDIARPKANETRSGFLPIERKWLDTLEKSGFVDAFRYLYPEKKEVYSWWDVITRARERNVGWRIDYIWMDQSLAPKIQQAFVCADVYGSDHCPVGVTLDMRI